LPALQGDVPKRLSCTLPSLFSKILYIYENYCNRILASIELRARSIQSRRGREGDSMNVTAFKRRKEFGKTLASDIAHRMRSEIVTCRFKPGEVLKFDTLRLTYGARFTTLREALTCLAAVGLVVAEEQ